MFLSVFLVVNTVTALLAQQRRQIGVMKAIGGTSPQILGMYLVMVMSYGVMALLLAIPLGIWGADALSRSLAAFFNFDLGPVEISPRAILLQVIVGLALPVLASLPTFSSSLKVTASEAMSAYAVGRRQFGSHWIGWIDLRIEPLADASPSDPVVPALDPEHVPEPGPTCTYPDNAYSGLSDFHQCFQRACIADQDG